MSSDVSYAQRDGSRCASCHAAPQNPAFSGTVDHGYQAIGDFRVGLTMIPSHDILFGVEARRVDAQWRGERDGPGAWNFAGGGTTVTLEDYTLVNVRLSWDAPVRIGSASEGLRFSVYGKNLLDEQEIEETFLPIDMRLPGSTFYGAVEVRF